MPASSERLHWFNEARFGMFIHFGLYALLGRGEWVRYQEAIPHADYAALADQFNPTAFDATAYAALAKRAGMRYMVMTAKHHDGFCLFDSQYTDFTTAKTAARRDLIGEYVAACRAAGLGVGIYFSVKDWSFPAYFDGPERNPAGWSALVDHFHNQALELVSNYGPIDILWFDCADDANFQGGWGARTAAVWRSAELEAQIRALQPTILLNNRMGLPGDFETPEQLIPASAASERAYESCLTMNEHWGYTPTDTRWKSTHALLGHLAASAARGANLLLNVGPAPDGRIPPPSVERLNAIGAWLERNGAAIYGTERTLPNWWDYTSVGRITSRGNHAYVTIDEWPADGQIVVAALANDVVSAALLATGAPLSVERRGRQVIIGGLPHTPPDQPIVVVALLLDGPPRAQYYGGTL